jgi:hypothetical protein
MTILWPRIKAKSEDVPEEKQDIKEVGTRDDNIFIQNEGELRETAEILENPEKKVGNDTTEKTINLIKPIYSKLYRSYIRTLKNKKN